MSLETVQTLLYWILTICGLSISGILFFVIYNIYKIIKEVDNEK